MRSTLLTLSVTALALAAPVAAQAADSRELPDTRQQATRVAPELRANYGAFRGPETTRDTIPSEVSLRAGFQERFYGINFDLSRRISGPVRRNFAWSGVWMTAGNNALCMYMVPRDLKIGSTTSTCSPTVRRAVRIGTVGTTGGVGKLKGLLTRVYGFMPDDVKTVTIRRRTGSKVKVPVRNNFYYKDMTRPDRVFYEAAGKRRSLRLLAPCDKGPNVC